MATPQVNKEKPTAPKAPPAVLEKLPAQAETKSLAFNPGAMGGAIEGLSSSDIVIPKILLMQGLSDLVAEGKAQMGEFRDSLEGTRLGSFKEPIEIIPLYAFKNWGIFVKNQGAWEYDRTENWTPENDNWSYEETLNGVTLKRERRLNFFVLLPHEIKDGAAFPRVLTFKSTSAKTGKQLATMIMKLAAFKKSSMDRVFSIGATLEKNDKGSFYVLSVAQGRATTPEEVEICKENYSFVKAANVKIDTSDEVAEKPSGPATTTEF